MLSRACAREIISIHALVKRATRYCKPWIFGNLHFNPRPREEGDLRLCVICVIVLYFNPRPREEGDTLCRALYMPQTISIHALVKRATNVLTTPSRTGDISIHALVKRATFCQNIATQHAIDFNPRPREEGDFAKGDIAYMRHAYFNPRPREEGDYLPHCKNLVNLTISIHALVKRATERHAGGIITDEISIHALVKRATSHYTTTVRAICISIHALVKRATQNATEVI